MPKTLHEHKRTRDCERVLGFLWRAHHWHWDGVVDIPVKGCDDDSTEMVGQSHCCHCGAINQTKDYGVG